MFGEHTVGLKEDGTCIAIGYNSNGQCNVASWSNIKQISCGDYHTVGLKEDGTCVAVGYNARGRCDIASWSNIKQISCGNSHTVGLKEDGTCVAVGNNDYGRCNVASWSNIKQISCGSAHTIGIKNDGTCVSVGNNDKGQCNIASWSNIEALMDNFIKYIARYLIKQNAHYCTIKPENYSNGKFNNLGNLIDIKLKENEKYMENNIKKYIKEVTILDETFRPIDKFDKFNMLIKKK